MAKKISAYIHKNKSSLLGLVVFFAVCITLIYYPVFDTDLGWHLRVGQAIFSNKHIPQVDTFSFSLSETPYIYHSWLTETLMWLSYQQNGISGVGFFFYTTLSIAFSLIWWRYTKNPWIGLVYLVLIPFVLGSIGLRTQVVTFLGLLFIWILSNPDLLRKKVLSKPNQKLTNWITKPRIIIIPLLFLVWTPLHPGFLWGLIVLGVSIIWLLLTNKNLRKYIYISRLSAVFIVSSLITVVNPYGWKLHQFILTMTQNTTAAQLNTDWVPYLSNPVFSTQHNLVLMIWVGLSLWASHKNKYQLFWLLGLSLLTLYNSRFIVPLFLVLLTLLPLVVKKLKPFGLTPKKLGLLSGAILIWQSPQVWNNIQRTNILHNNPPLYAQYAHNHYPYEAVHILKEYQDLNILNFYDWGGYVIWQLPQHKVFIDGRMDNFFVDGVSFMQTYQDLIDLNNPNWQQTLEYYNVNAVLLPPNMPIVQKLKESPSWNILHQDKTSILVLKNQ